MRPIDFVRSAGYPGHVPDQPNPRRFASLARQVVTPWQTSIRPTWSISGIRAALLALRQGEFALASQLYDSLLEDDEIPGDLEKRVNALLRSEFHFKAPDGEDRKLNRREQAAEAAFPEMVPDGELFDLIASWLVLGFGIGTIDWKVDGPLWIPVFRALPPEFLSYREHERKWYYQSQEGEQVVTPGDGKWVLLARGQRPWNWGMIRALSVLWLSKQLTYGDWQRYCQKHGLPIIKAKIPIFRDDKEKDRFIQDLGDIQSEGVVGLPTGPEGDGYDVELLEATDGSWEAFQANLERADRKIQIRLLGSNIGTEQSAATGGSRSAAETSARGVDQDKAKSDEKYVSQCILEQILRPFFELNFGPSVPAPEPHWDVCPEEDAREWAEAQGMLVDMLNKIRTTGFKLANAEELAKEYGLELEEDPDAPPAAGTEAAAEIAAKAKPPTAEPPAKRKLDQSAPEATGGDLLALELGFEELDALPGDAADWIELSDDQVDALARAAAKRGAGGPKSIQTGPRGGKFYISPKSGKKVYIKKGAAAPKGKGSGADKPAAKTKKKPAPKDAKTAKTPKAGSGSKVAGGDVASRKAMREHLTRLGADKLAKSTGAKVTVELDHPKLENYDGRGGKAAGLYYSDRHAIMVKNDTRAYDAASDNGRIVIKAGVARREMTMTHEFGHAVHLHGERHPQGSFEHERFKQVDAVVQRGARQGNSVSSYGRVNKDEYFAEAFTAYHHRRDLLDAAGVRMVEQVLELRGMK